MATSKRRRRQAVRAEPLAPLTVDTLANAADWGFKEFEDVCGIPKAYITKAWWVVAIAKVLRERGLYVQTEPRSKRMSLGSFYRAVGLDWESGVDILACEKWSSTEIDSEDYGKDEGYLPSFHVVQIACDHFGHAQGYATFSEKWMECEATASTIKGPLTLSLVFINREDGAEDRFLAAQRFDHDMRALRLDHSISTRWVGIEGSLLITDRYEPFQLLVASKTWRRRPFKNLDFDPDFMPRLPRRGRRRTNLATPKESP